MIKILIAIDGACKRNGQPDCISVGAAWIQTEDGKLLFKSKLETCSTSQRGELNGLLEALRYAVGQASPTEDIILITDSEYIYNTVALSWCFKWRDNGWTNADGNETKNTDMWTEVCQLLDALNNPVERVFIEWTKGHCVHYTPGNTKMAMRIDPSGIELYTRISTIAHMPANMDNIIAKFLTERREHDKPAVPREVALEWAIANATVDCIASYVVNLMNNAII